MSGMVVVGGGGGVGDLDSVCCKGFLILLPDKPKTYMCL